jgi:putative isomerase
MRNVFCCRSLLVTVFAAGIASLANAQNKPASQGNSRIAPGDAAPLPRSEQYEQVQERLARGWNTWDVHSVATQVLLPEGLAIHVGMKHNSSLNGDAFLGDALIGRLDKDAEVVTPGPHAWDGSYTSADFAWKGHKWRMQTKSSGRDVDILVTPLSMTPSTALPPTMVVWVDYLWSRTGIVVRNGDVIEARSGSGTIPIYCSCREKSGEAAHQVSVPIGGEYFAADLTVPIEISTSKPDKFVAMRMLRQGSRRGILVEHPELIPVADAIETTLGWDTIYEPKKGRVISPVSRVWSVNWGGYVLFDWDTFFAATMAGIGDKDLAYANALETLREQTAQGFVPNYARAGNWKSSDRSEPPVGAITVLGLYRKFHDRWFLEDAFGPLLSWNRWWNEHRQMQGFIVLGSDPENQPANLDDGSKGTWQGAVYESGLDNSPMYDGTFYNPRTHLLEYADVGMTSLYIADCDALAEMADEIGRTAEAKELRERAARYRAKLATLWDEKAGIFLNKDLHTGQRNTRLSPTNFYPLLAKAATPEQARTMIEKHLLNKDEFWGEWIMPSIARNDPAFRDQEYWRGRIWGPMNYLVYLGLQNYDDAAARKDFARKSYELFLKEWSEKGHVHENYNAIIGTGDDVTSSDRFYHWGALLGYVEYVEQTHP